MAREPKCKLINGICPKNSDPEKGDYCPAWDDHGIVWEKDDGQTLIYNCAYASLAPALMNVMKAGNRAAAASESNRNEIVEGLGKLTQAVQSVDTKLIGPK